MVRGNDKLPIFKDAQDKTLFLERLGQNVTNLCDEDNYLLVIVRYIHLNPIRGKIITTMKELDRATPWSGHGTIMGITKQEWMDTFTVLINRTTIAKRGLDELGVSWPR